jgi:hypothetical protein
LIGETFYSYVQRILMPALQGNQIEKKLLITIDRIDKNRFFVKAIIRAEPNGM